MIVVDAHQDIAYNYLGYRRDYPRSAWWQRRREARHAGHTAGLATNGLPDALLGRIAVVFATLFAKPAWSPLSLPDRLPGYETPQQAYKQALRQWDYYQRLFEADERLLPVTTERELDEVLATWADGTEMPDHRIGFVLLMEGADPVLEPKQLEEWYERGVRIVGPAWSATRYAGGTGQPGQLTDLGRELLDVMADFHMVLDLSHTTEHGYLEALDRYDSPIIASHSNPTAFWNHHRNLTDLQIERLAGRDGVIGICLYSRFLSETWYEGAPKSEVPFETLLAAIDHVCQVTGSAAHVGIGSDVDGGFGAESAPAGIDTVTDFLRIGEALTGRGYDAEAVEAIMSGNFLRILRRALP